MIEIFGKTCFYFKHIYYLYKVKRASVKWLLQKKK